jgi:hypothetical protein
MTTKPSSNDGLADEPFSYRSTKDGKLLISWTGKLVSTFKGNSARKWLAKLSGADTAQVQLILAKATGNFKRGNERQPK